MVIFSLPKSNSPPLAFGVPGLKSAGALDPLHINEVKIENSKSPLAIDVDLKDVEIKGLSSVHMEEPSYDTKKLVFTTKLKVPKFTIKSNYKMKGKIVQLDLNTDGKLELDIEHLIAKVMMKFKLYDRYCHTFTHLEELHLEITDIKGLNIYMTNLFKGQKDLEENLNKQFNDNWKEFYEVLRPTISSTAESVMKYRLGEVFDYVPATYIVSDLPNASSHHKQN
ncbi:circadian clock-controlled protein daywake-like [Haematobia irritans]|uniref:circadian clock-controlled protein daywake-like n=1 Tax=Haematobia irritans TaxID=7368 RepID=UPI003F5029A2